MYEKRLQIRRLKSVDAFCPQKKLALLVGNRVTEYRAGKMKVSCLVGQTITAQDLILLVPAPTEP